ncbi:hypothetical protein CMO91_01480 [Candidatus Woesearchaeota archaeon]|nr:hypothetical protein [Candidatus Woesearchaeota archaeon]
MRVYSIPFSGGSMGKNQGCERGPEAILSHATEVSHLGKPLTIQNQTVNVFSSDFPATQLSILNTVQFPSVCLGGDHSITFSTFKAFAQQHPGAALVVFDAHPDLMQEFDVPTHENYLRMLLADGCLLPERLVMVGTRAWDPEELRFVKEKGIKAYNADEVKANRDKIAHEILHHVQEAPLFISVDIDVLDPSVAPATGYPEQGGLSSADLLYFLAKLCALETYKGADIVEVNPQLDSQGRTATLAAKILAELALDSPL